MCYDEVLALLHQVCALDALQRKGRITACIHGAIVEVSKMNDTNFTHF